MNKKWIIAVVFIALVILLFPTTTVAKTNENIEILFGVVGISNSEEFTFIKTADGNGWAIDRDFTLQTGDRVMIIYDTSDIGNFVRVVEIKSK